MEICTNLPNDSAPGQFSRPQLVDRISRGTKFSRRFLHELPWEWIVTAVLKKPPWHFHSHGSFNRRENSRLALFNANWHYSHGGSNCRENSYGSRINSGFKRSWECFSRQLKIIVKTQFFSSVITKFWKSKSF